MRVKLIGSFMLVCLLVLVVGLLGLSKLASGQQRLKTMDSDSMASLTAVADIKAAFYDVKVTLRDIAIAQGPTAKGAAEQTLTAKQAALDVAIGTLATLHPDDQTDFAKLGTDVAAWRLALPAVVDLAASNDLAGFANDLSTVVVPRGNAASADIAALAAAEGNSAAAAVKTAGTQYQSARALIIGIVVAAIILAMGLALLISSLITRPLAKTVKVLAGLADGRLDQHVDVTDRSEVGAMGQSLNTAIDRIRDVLVSIREDSQILAAASEELTAISSVVSASSEESSTQAHVVAAAAKQISINITTVAAAGEEMGAAIQEIASSASRAATIANQAAATADAANATIAQLGDSSDEIGVVVRTIASIAQQTNLLALNATIEAARAGEAGNGFAVVAGEVKELAQAAARASDDVAARVAATQSDVEAAVAALTEITGVITQINDIQGVISGAVEEQSATTNEMVRNISEVSDGSEEIASNVTGIASAARETTTGAAQTAQAADELARVAAHLNQSVGTFHL